MLYMDFKVFLSYSATSEEQALVWRLQTLATAEGIQVYVPPRADSRLASARSSLMPSVGVRHQIDSSDCILPILANGVNPEVHKELSYARGRNKLIIPPIVAEGTAQSSLLQEFPLVFWYSPRTNIGELETRIVEFLKEQMRNKAQRQALGALIGIGLGLFLLSAAAKE